MRSLRFHKLLIVLFALGLIGVGQARGDEPSPNFPSLITWSRSTIDSDGDAGSYASLALDPLTGLPHVSYFKNNNSADLAHAYKTNNPINTPCQTADWECEVFANPGDNDGYYSSIDVRNNGNYGILFFNNTKNAIFFRGDQGDNIPFSNVQIYSPTVPNFLSFKYGQNGSTHGVYGASRYLFYLKYTGSGGNCGSGTWQCDIIYSEPSGYIFIGGDVGVSANNTPHIAIGNPAGLTYISQVGTNGNCSSQWRCDQIESTFVVGNVALYQPDCLIICTSPVQIAYVGFVNGLLKIATSVESGGNCGVGDQAGKWRCDIIESVGPGIESDVAITRYGGKTYIVYTDRNDRTNETLKVAYPSEGGNCGPTLNGAGTWQCDTIDTGLRYTGGFPFYHDVGEYPAIAINDTGNFYAAYYDSDARDLVVAEAQLEVLPPSDPYEVYLPAILP